MCDSATRPAFIPVPETCRVRMVYTFGSNTYMNVFYFHKAGMVASDVSTIVDETIAAWNSDIKNLQTSVLTLAYVEGTKLDSAADTQITASVNTAGTGSSEALPFGSSIVIKFSGGLTGRSQRGRLYHIGLTELQTTANTVDAIAAANIRTSYETFFNAIGTAATAEHVVVSYCHDGVWRTTGQVTPVLFYLLTDTNIDSQRRRLNARGM